MLIDLNNKVLDSSLPIKMKSDLVWNFSKFDDKLKYN